MKLLLVSLVLAIAASSCSARLPWHKRPKMEILEKIIHKYDIVERAHINDLSKSAENLAMRIFHEGVLTAEAPRADGLIPAVAQSLGLTTLVEAVVSAGLKETLESAGPFTVFGPTNEAFANLPGWAKKAINDTKVLADILKYHVLSGAVMSSDLKNDLLATTVEGKQVRINIYDTASDAKVYTAQCAPIDLSRVDQKASNGVVHVLKAVMLPPSGTVVGSLKQCPAFKILVEAVVAAGLADTLNGAGPFTVFAPTDKAFRKLPPGTLEKLLKNPKMLAKILTYHVVPGTYCSAGLSSGSVKTVEGQEVKVMVSSAGVKVNDATVITADGSVSNGVVHAIDTVLLPPSLELL